MRGRHRPQAAPILCPHYQNAHEINHYQYTHHYICIPVHIIFLYLATWVEALRLIHLPPFAKVGETHPSAHLDGIERGRRRRQTQANVVQTPSPLTHTMSRTLRSAALGTSTRTRTHARTNMTADPRAQSRRASRARRAPCSVPVSLLRSLSLRPRPVRAYTHPLLEPLPTTHGPGEGSKDKESSALFQAKTKTELVAVLAPSSMPLRRTAAVKAHPLTVF